MSLAQEHVVSRQRIPWWHRLFRGLILLGLLTSCAAFDQEPQCTDNTVPPWWSNYRVDGLERGKITGAGSERRAIRKEAERAATASAEREMSSWLNRLFHRVTTEYATERERNNATITPQRVLDLVEEIVGPYVAASSTSHHQSILRCDGKIDAYVLVEIDVEGVSSDVTQRVIEELSGEQAYRSAAIVRRLEGRLESELMKLVVKKPEVRESTSERIAVSFASTPDGAEVWIGGSRRCVRTPCEVNLGRGPHQVEMRKSGYSHAAQSVDLRHGQHLVRWTLSSSLDRMDGSAAISAGGRHSCAIQGGTGNVVCWGSNDKGQAAPPSSVNGRTGTAKSIATGWSHSCAIQGNTGSVVCWGDNQFNQATPPKSVNGRDGSATSIAADSDHSCAIQANTGNIVCWGSNLLGVATPPRSINGAKGTATEISAGPTFDCAIQSNTSKVVCWGPGRDDRLAPPNTVNGSKGAAKDISVGSNHACAIQKNTGKVVCWGSNRNRRATPPSSVNGKRGTAGSIVAGSSHSCAIQAKSGNVICWGSIKDGRANAPDSVNGIDGTATSISAGRYHSCAIQSYSNKVVCWGSNKEQQATPPGSINGTMEVGGRDALACPAGSLWDGQACRTKVVAVQPEHSRDSTGTGWTKPTGEAFEILERQGVNVSEPGLWATARFIAEGVQTEAKGKRIDRMDGRVSWIVLSNESDSLFRGEKRRGSLSFEVDTPFDVRGIMGITYIYRPEIEKDPDGWIYLPKQRRVFRQHIPTDPEAGIRVMLKQALEGHGIHVERLRLEDVTAKLGSSKGKVRRHIDVGRLTKGR